MPTLVVHKSQLEDAREFLSNTGIRAHLVAFEGWEREPKERDAPFLTGAEVAFVGIRKGYVRAAERLYRCRALCSLATIRGGRDALVRLLAPQARPEAEVLLAPRAAFEAAAHAEPRLVLADGALDSADRLVDALHPFVNRAAGALREYASLGARAPAGLQLFFAERGLDFAPSGGTGFTYLVLDSQGEIVSPQTQRLYKHLKQGDRKNTPEECGRIYFDALKGRQEVIVLRCGPHPPGDFDVVVRLR